MDNASVRLFGLSGLALGIIGNAVTYFLLIFYNQVHGVPAHLVSLALGIALLFDACSDPLVGMWSDRMQSKWGRRHPFILLAGIPLACLYVLLWNPPAWAFGSEAISLLYLTTLLVVFRLVFTLIDVPFNAMLAELTRDYDQRTRMASARMSVAWVGGIGFAALMYGVFLQPSEAYPVGVLNLDGYQHASWLGGAVIAISILVSALGLRKHIPTLRQPRDIETLTLKEALQTIKSIVASGPFRALMAFSVVFRSTDGLFAALVVYMWTYFWLIDSTQIALLSLANLVGAFVAMVITPRLARNQEKRTIIIWGNLAFLLTGTLPISLRLFGFIPDEHTFAVLLSIAVFEISVFVLVLSILNSMIADIVEDVQRDSQVRHEGAVVSAQTLMTKVSTAVGTWVAGMLLTGVGFPEGGGSVMPEVGVVQDLAAAYLAVQFCGTLVCVVLMFRFKLSRAAHETNLQATGEAG
ncbi:MAG: MFS transporter [Pseudomonadota bacterium]